MKIWIARERNFNLYGHSEKPILVDEEWVSMDALYNLDADLFPEVTFENSPQQVELKLVEE